VGSIPTPGSNMSIYTYLIKSLKDKSYYTGISNNPYKRLDTHNRGGLKNTSLKKPYILVYLKPHSSYIEARNHEKWLKKKNREYKNVIAHVAQLAPPISGGVK